jgi:hypothetical protein
MNGNFWDFNDAEEQRGDLVPNGTVCLVSMTIRPGGIGQGGWLRKSGTSDAQYLDCELTVVDGPYARRKFWQNITISGGKVNEKGESIAANISRSMLRAILESARNISPADASEAALNARKVKGFEDFDGIRFVVKIGVEKGKEGYADKNKIACVITPDKKEYAAAMRSAQPDVHVPPLGVPAWAEGSGSPPPAASAPPQQQAPRQPTNIPSWAQ